MGFLEESCASLLSPLRQSASKGKVLSGGSPLEKDSARAFDIADSMEKGLAHELVADFMEPLPDSSSLWKFSVARSGDRQRYRLCCDGGEFLLHARASRDSRRVDIYLYDPEEKEGSLFDPQRPAFTLTCNPARSEWRLLQERCDGCRHSPAPRPCRCGGQQEIMRVRHSNVRVGDGVNHCMDVTTPVHGYFGPTQEQRFVSKLPVWNDKVECLVLDFEGRKIAASAKNFQLACEEDDSERVVCQYGKLSQNTFGLDFRYPLTVVQAFGLSLTTMLWA